jgi:two-component system nitrogen regulation response regulator NtrX
MRRVLIIDDERNIRTQLSGLLADEGYAALTAEDAEKGLEVQREESPDLVLLDVWLPGMDGLEALGKIREERPELPVIVMSGQATIETAVQATKLGAFDYLQKPLEPERLLVAVRNALETGTLRQRNRELSRQVSGRGLIGSSDVMQQLRDEVERAAQSGARVLIMGENGTGKEIVARALHDGSPRADGPFVRVNCAAIPKDLIESELFGHEKGSFTGASARKIGKLEAADGGSLLLDEVGDMAIEAQAKLLRVLEENEVERVGGNQAIPVDVRVIAATNKDLSQAIEANEFREDLYYRLNVVPIPVPPLRERASDIPELADHFRTRFAEEAGRPLPELTEDAYRALGTWTWPGNVRELRNAVERLLIMTEGEWVDGAAVRAILQGARGPTSSEGEADLDGAALSLREILDRTERRAIRRALEDADGTISEAARVLGMDRANLHRKMRRLGIDRDTNEQEPAEDVSS